MAEAPVTKKRAMWNDNIRKVLILLYVRFRLESHVQKDSNTMKPKQWDNLAESFNHLLTHDYNAKQIKNEWAN